MRLHAQSRIVLYRLVTMTLHFIDTAPPFSNRFTDKAKPMELQILKKGSSG